MRQTHFYTAILFIFLLKSVHGQNFTEEEELLNWSAPDKIKKLLPYALSGYDNDGSPVWPVDVGKWKFREISGSKEYGEDVLKYARQSVVRILNPVMYSQPSNPKTSFVIIMNMDGYSLQDLVHPPTVRVYLTGAAYYAEQVQKKRDYTHKVIIVNANFFFQNLFNLIKPLIGSAGENVELYGTNPDKWRPVLLVNIPRDQLPEHLGGLKTHVPVKIFG